MAKYIHQQAVITVFVQLQSQGLTINEETHKRQYFSSKQTDSTLSSLQVRLQSFKAVVV
jgi:hypothetical protein